jgi:hypothetical protein
MALSKNIQYPNGTETNYHKIHSIALTHYSEIRTDPTGGEDVFDTSYYMEITVYSYVSKEIRKVSSHNYLTNYNARVVCDAADVENKNIMHLAYDLLKTLPEFADAEDV